MGNLKKRIALFLALCLIVTGMTPVQANAGAGTSDSSAASASLDRLASQIKEDTAKLPAPAEYFQPDDMVRAIVVLEEPSLSERGFNMFSLSEEGDASIAAIERTLVQGQDMVLADIQNALAKTGEDKQLEVNYNYTRAINGMSVTVPFKSLDEIRKVDGVKKVFVAPVYSVPEDQVSVGSMIYQEYAWESGYTGAGMKIAIIDTGIDSDHPSFAAAPQLTADSLNESTISLKISELHAQERLSGLTSTQVYLSAKIPYAFNYVDGNLVIDHSKDAQGDHGTHVAGIAAANQVEGVLAVGVAPDAQLLVMKVFGAAGGAYMDDILAAIEDAAVLGADVVNLSLGSPAGFASEDEEIDAIYARVFELGTFASISAGNEYTAAYGNQYGYNMSLASNPDNGIVGSPSTYSEATSVASIESAEVLYNYIQAGEDKYTYTDTSSNYPELGIQDFLNTLGGQTFEIVAVDNLGASVEDFTNADVAGKIALVQRGEVAFTDKQANAAEAGAVACIIYNNTTGLLGIDFSNATATIPCVTVSQAAGADLVNKCRAVSGTSETVQLYISGKTEVMVEESETAWEMSGFSSWGTAPDLALRPDITAPGGNIYSTLDGGNYGNMSGTSMAAPKLAGSAALLLQKLKEAYPNMSKADRKVLADRILMSTAEPVVDPDASWYYSPRKQGSGLVNVENALKTNAYLSVPGAEKPKAELGDDETKSGIYEYTFEVNNTSGIDLYYALDTSVQTEKPASDGYDLFMYGLPFPLNRYAVVTYTSAAKVDLGTVSGSAETVSVDGAAVSEFVWSAEGDMIKGYLDGSDEYVIKVPANGTAAVTVQIQLGEDAKGFLDNYVNGIYVEGFTFLRAVAGSEVDLSLPYLAFYGDWTQAPVFDAAWAWEDTQPSQYWHAIFMDSGIPSSKGGTISAFPGENLFTGEIDLDRAAVSPNGDGMWDGIDDIYLSLLRNAKELDIVFSNAETDEIYEIIEIDYVRKSVYRSSYRMVVPFIYSWYAYPYDFTYETEDGTREMIPENTKVKVTFAAYGDFDKFGNDTPDILNLEATFLVDITAPELVETESVKSDDGDTLKLSIQDNGYIQFAAIYTQAGETVAVLPLDNQVPGQPLVFEIPAENAAEPVILEMIDYAGNIADYEIQYAEPTATPTPTVPVSGPITVAATPTPTPTPEATPTEEPAEPEVVVEEVTAAAETVVEDDSVKVEVALSEEEVEAILEKKEALKENETLKVSIVVPETITAVSEEVNDVVIFVELPEALVEAGIETGVILPAKLLENAKETAVNLTAVVWDADKNALVTWRFTAAQLAASAEELADVLLLADVENVTKAELTEETAKALDEKAEVVTFAHKGVLPATAEITIKTDFTTETKLYLYYYNEDKNCLDELPETEYTVGEDGAVTFRIVHCSSYVLTPEKATENVRTLEEQIEGITKAQKLYVGGTAGITLDVKPSFPSTLKESADLSAVTDPASMGVKFTYTSSKPSVVSVDENGLATAKKKGTATITVTAELANGSVKEFVIPVTVKKASAKLIIADKPFNVGGRLSVSLDLKGYDASDIVWMTKKRDIAVVGKNKGKTTAVVKAVSAGTDKILIYAGDKLILSAAIVVTEPEEASADEIK